MEKIKQWAQVMAQYNLTRIKIEDKDINIELERANGHFMPVAYAGPVTEVAPTARESSVFEPAAVQPAGFDPFAVPANPNLAVVKAPMVGVFYAASSPEADPFVRIGSVVKPGDTLGILEAMKMMNEIQAECSGVVEDICIKNGDVAEYGQILFTIDTTKTGAGNEEIES